MSQLTLRDIDESLMNKLQRRAAAHGRTVEAEAESILAQSLGGLQEDVWVRVDAIHTRLAASGQTFSDSAELLREDRDR